MTKNMESTGKFCPQFSTQRSIHPPYSKWIKWDRMKNSLFLEQQVLAVQQMQTWPALLLPQQWTWLPPGSVHQSSGSRLLSVRANREKFSWYGILTLLRRRQKKCFFKVQAADSFFQSKVWQVWNTQCIKFVPAYTKNMYNCHEKPNGTPAY